MSFHSETFSLLPDLGSADGGRWQGAFLLHPDWVGVDPGPLFIVDLQPDLGAVDARFGDGMIESASSRLGNLHSLVEEADQARQRGRESQLQCRREGDLRPHDANPATVPRGDEGEAGWVTQPVVGHIGPTRSERLANSGLRQPIPLWQQQVGGHELETALIGVEVDLRQQIAGASTLEQRRDCRDLSGRNTAWRVTDDADLDCVCGDGTNLIDLVVVAVVGGDPGQRTFAQIAVPLGNGWGMVVLERPKDFERVAVEKRVEQLQSVWIGECSAEPADELELVLHVRMVVVDLQPIETFR